MNDPSGARGGTSSMRWAALAGGVLAVGVLLYAVEPTEAAWLPRCPVHWLTGWHCPGCGSTRAAHALLHGDVSRAAAFNPLFVVGAPVVLAFCAWQRKRLGPGWTTAISLRWILFLAAVLVAYTLLRNVPAWPFDLLAPH
jgi:Protein of unknown function (DUF2752)